jgi:hypothetical protein
MKTIFTSTIRRVVLIFIFSWTIISFPTHAQHYSNSRPKRIFLGMQAGVGTRFFHLSSDLSELNIKNQIQEGGNVGIIFGDQRLVAKVRQGFFHSSSQEAKSQKQSESYVSVQYVPTRSRKKIFKYFSPYLTSGLSLNSIKSSGTYTPWSKKVNDISSPDCCCKHQFSQGGGMMADPDQLNATVEKQDDDAAEPYSGKFKTSRLNIGVGFQTNIKKKNIFAHLFAEVRYGIVTASHNTVPALLHTNASNMVAVDFGVALGLTGIKP